MQIYEPLQNSFFLPFYPALWGAEITIFKENSQWNNSKSLCRQKDKRHLSRKGGFKVGSSPHPPAQESSFKRKIHPKCSPKPFLSSKKINNIIAHHIYNSYLLAHFMVLVSLLLWDAVDHIYNVFNVKLLVKSTASNNSIFPLGK